MNKIFYYIIILIFLNLVIFTKSVDASSTTTVQYKYDHTGQRVKYDTEIYPNKFTA